MTRCIRRAALFCVVLLVALLANTARVQLVQAEKLADNHANRRHSIARYGQSRGNILVDGRPVTGSRDSGEQLRYERTYLEGPLYAPVTGYASQTYGTSFVEHAADDILSGGHPALAFPLWNDLTRALPRGGHAATTIRASMQRAAYTGLAGRRGAVAAVEPATGRILALVSSPSYDPQLLSGNSSAVTEAWQRLNADPSRPMLSRAIRETYPPGSTFKIITAAAALDAGVVRDIDAPTRTPDPFVLPGTSTVLPNEAVGCENASLAYAVQWSCNTVMAGLGVKVGLQGMVDAARKFGFNDSGLRMPFVVSRSNFDTDMSLDQLALSSIGQFNTRATPLQMAMVAAAVAGGGDIKLPHLLERTTDAAGNPVTRTGTKSLSRAINRSTALKLRRMMVKVVKEGSGHKAAIPGAEVGGKTGTAQHGLGNTGAPYAWFISWAKAHGSPQPAVALAVVVEDASAHREDISGGGSAAPIARAVMEAALLDKGEG
ncbi:penicillin-binding transpeptidase domain-containing protein [Streptomyces sp. A3M-1-3]|uniref:penicillin-binding transpeptidase domain-containing protein n=1 Tax=Streptomyces sp. A3M-1-3 TaxID=2962044 RepID=UPI0020B70633|nr:penicillin-binding transpeptidase domain-containing protein [Streptomyces sp. A3M-1-3]MCP3821720.1 penicillin-binding transpeptidase domain-containing protein [Streptomyces sp. A3M-1-3]